MNVVTNPWCFTGPVHVTLLQIGGPESVGKKILVQYSCVYKVTSVMLFILRLSNGIIYLSYIFSLCMGSSQLLYSKTSISSTSRVCNCPNQSEFSPTEQVVIGCDGPPRPTHNLPAYSHCAPGPPHHCIQAMRTLPRIVSRDCTGR